MHTARHLNPSIEGLFFDLDHFLEQPMASEAPIEIERKFLVNRNQFLQAQPDVVGQRICQGYWTRATLPVFFADMVQALEALGGFAHLDTVRAQGPDALELRVRQRDERFWVTFKSRQELASGGVAEYEIEVPARVAEPFLAKAQVRLSKTRYELPLGSALTLEVDLFEDLGGLAMAEVEIPALDTVLPALPAWVGEEVTGQPAYFNRNLAENGQP